jgi:Mn-dependent DtxR family transcriptional regulator
VSKEPLSAAIQDYLKEIYKLESEGTRPTTTAIARRMGVAPSSVT